VIGVSEDADLLVTHVLMEDRAAAVSAARKISDPVYFYRSRPRATSSRSSRRGTSASEC
jgi:hypothetical protein